MDLYNNHKTLYGTAIGLFLFLTLFVAILPALRSDRDTAPLPQSHPLSQLEEKGRLIFISEGCVGCHTQQVRNLDMDKTWGQRPSIAADYGYLKRTDGWRNTAALLGSERTGPDLTNIGSRQPSSDWHLLHLYNPRSVVEASVMPAYAWLFEEKDAAAKGDVLVNVPDAWKSSPKVKVVASARALALVAYLQSLQQTALPDGRVAPRFLYPKAPAADAGASGGSGGAPSADGAALYATNCQSCHQANGEGLPGAFPPLKGSKVVLDPDPSLQIDIIMKGYNGRVSEGYGIMPAIGTNNNLKPEEVAAIVNHERSSWGNNSKSVNLADVQRLIDSVQNAKPAAK